MAGHVFGYLQDIIFNFKRCSHFRIMTSMHHFVKYSPVHHDHATDIGQHLGIPGGPCFTLLLFPFCTGLSQRIGLSEKLKN
jgi:hypothetical protein